MTELESLEDVWSELALRSGNIFLTHEWAAIWWRHHGAGRPLRIVVVRHPRRGIVALVPLYLRRVGPLRVLRLLGHGPADELGPVADPDDLPEVLPLVRRSLAEHGRRLGDLVLLDHLSERSLPALGEPAQVLARSASPLVRFDGRGWDGYLASRSKNFRGQMARRERKLAAEPGVRFRLAGPDLGADLETLFALHRERWGHQTPFLRDRAFHSAFASAGERRGWLRLGFVEAGDEPICAVHGFRYADVESFYQSGRRTHGLEGHSVGSTLLYRFIREAAESDMREYRLLRGDETYKSRFATGDDPVVTVAIAASGFGRPAGRALALLVAGRRRAKPWVARVRAEITARARAATPSNGEDGGPQHPR